MHNFYLLRGEILVGPQGNYISREKHRVANLQLTLQWIFVDELMFHLA